MKKLPIAIQTFSEIRQENYCYVDKTPHVFEMLEQGKQFFLSRPRRFGKSLFVDTLKELFEGNKSLFEGLYIYDKWDWEQTFPVIKFDFGDGVLESRAELDERIGWLLEENAKRLNLTIDTQTDIAGRFANLIHTAHKANNQQVVILVDEYDKPILDNIDHPDIAVQMRNGLKNLYSVMKGQGAHIRFVFMTGVSKFSKVSLFSGINQLKDITLSPRFATICGYTQHDLESTFVNHLQGVDWQELRLMYNGYQFLGEPVYNPYDILLFISEDLNYRNFWFETGSPSFLIKLFKQYRYFLPNLENIEVSEEILDSFDVEQIDPITLLFQAGYLTIVGHGRAFGQQSFTLRVPNQEVRSALNNHFASGYTELLASNRVGFQHQLYEVLRTANLEELVTIIKRVFAAIPWRNFTNNDLPEAEGYYASVLYAFFASLNAEIIPEDINNHGQVDLTIRLEGFTYVMEIKLDRSEAEPAADSANPALTQIQKQGYSDKYRDEPGRGLFEVGLVFSSHTRNLVQADWCEVGKVGTSK